MEYFFEHHGATMVFFVHEGRGTLETTFGPIEYAKGDFLIVPKGITHRFELAAGAHRVAGLVLVGADALRQDLRDEIGMRGLPGVPAAVDADSVPGAEGDLPRAQDVVELPPVHRLVMGHEALAAVTGHVEDHPARDDAVAPVLDGAERRPVEGDLALGVTAVPHPALVPRVAERVEVGGLDPVIEDPVVVGGPGSAALAAPTAASAAPRPAGAGC